MTVQEGGKKCSRPSDLSAGLTVRLLCTKLLPTSPLARPFSFDLRAVDAGGLLADGHDQGPIPH
jgi:hypothetical protein